MRLCAALAPAGVVFAIACGSSTTPSGSGSGGQSATSTGHGTTKAATSASSDATSTSGTGGAAATSTTSTSGGTGGETFSCDVPGQTPHVCAEYDNVPQSALSGLQSTCMAEMGTAGTGCPTANRLGVCAGQPNGGLAVKESYYSDGGTTAMQAQMACMMEGGTWTPG